MWSKSANVDLFSANVVEILVNVGYVAERVGYRDGPLINGKNSIFHNLAYFFLESSFCGLKIYLMKFCNEIGVIITYFNKTLIH